jgi:outer membrane protein OmpA-like peptidoglycan-associated protein
MIISLALVAGCAAPPVVAPPAPATIEAPVVAPGSSSELARGATFLWTDKLDSAGQKLRSRLSGGPAVAQTTDKRLWVSLPAGASFAAGRSAVKAPATGWLDQVALALRELPRSEVEIVSDADAGGSSKSSQQMALDRAASARDWLVIRGIAAPRITVAARKSGASKSDDPRLDILIGERSR